MTGEEFGKFDSRLAPVQSADLIKHMEKHYSDWLIVEDLDSVLAACASRNDRELVQNYADARRKSPGFNPRDYAHNNHEQIDPELLHVYTVTNERLEEVCQGGCGIPFAQSLRSSDFVAQSAGNSLFGNKNPARNAGFRGPGVMG